ncbi:MAG: hypothetical protein Q4A17_03355 [Thermoguttaceae bacterium]|nr:hypothetical protein [Thermoguttaceae bacterium]
MTKFTDNTGYEWVLDIKVRDIERVKAHVTGINGKPVDLLEIAEKGDFSSVSGSVQIILKVIFWLLLDDIMANFDRESWDRDHATLYEVVPEEKRKTLIQKAADWFGERIGSEQVIEMVRAWEAALLGFIPNPRVREAVEKVMDKQEVYQTKLIETAEATVLKELDRNQEALGASSMSSQEKSGSRRKGSRSGS